MPTNRDWSLGHIELPSASDVALSGKVSGDSSARWTILADGTITGATFAPTTQTTFTQTYSTTTTTVPNATAVAVATTSATNSSPYGFGQTQADAIVTNLNALVADVLANRKLINAVIDALQAAGISL